VSGEVRDVFALAPLDERVDEVVSDLPHRLLVALDRLRVEEGVEPLAPFVVIRRIGLLRQDQRRALGPVDEVATGTAERLPVLSAAAHVAVVVENAVAGTGRAVRHRTLGH